jgi:hypothetical protein
MAYTQTPGRGNSMKTGSGLSSALLQKSPKKFLTEREISIEKGAKNDSIEASNKAGDLFTRRQRAQIGNKAANKTRAVNGSSVTVTKTEVEGKKGKEDKYKMTPAKQMSKLGGKKAPAKMKKC